MEQNKEDLINQSSNEKLEQPPAPSEPDSEQIPGRPLTFPQKHKKLLSFIAVSLAFAIVGLGVYVGVTMKRQKIQPSPLTITSSPVQEEIRKEGKVGVQYFNREELFETVNIPEGEDFRYHAFDFYKVGTIKEGKYKDGDLILVLVYAHGPCKSRGCGKPIRLRYIREGNKIVFLPKISLVAKLYGVSDELDLSVINPFKKFGLTLVVDNDFTILNLEYPKEISGNNPGQVLSLLDYSMEEDGKVDEAKLTPVFEHELLGAVYTTRPELSSNKSFYEPGPGLVVISDDPTVGGCEGASCFSTNAFYVFRPDGTFLKYIYKLYFTEKDVQWNDKTSPENKYISQTISGCSHVEYDYVSVVSSEAVGDKDLTSIGQVKTTGDLIYGLADFNHELYKEFYKNYKKNLPEWEIYTSEDINLDLSYEEFLASRPIFFWRDPFGRLIRFNNTDFLPPHYCEPIIYLYPEEETEVNIKLGKNVEVSDSTPSYEGGWNVIAGPTGTIFESEDGKPYSYLFWEGWSYIFSIRKEGFVVEQEEVPELFVYILPKLGLNKKETDDFLEAWLPYFSDAPYYFITFIDQEVINKIAPLEINPKPDTVIRILMDYRPLEEPITAPELSLPETPQRKGFTVVEWGGLRR